MEAIRLRWRGTFNGFQALEPLGGLTLDSSGNIYGTTSAGGMPMPAPCSAWGQAAKLSFTLPPAPADVAGTPIGEPKLYGTVEVQVSIEDAAGNVAANDDSNVTLTLTGGTFAGGGTTETVRQ